LESRALNSEKEKEREYNKQRKKKQKQTNKQTHKQTTKTKNKKRNKKRNKDKKKEMKKQRLKLINKENKITRRKDFIEMFILETLFLICFLFGMRMGSEHPKSTQKNFGEKKIRSNYVHSPNIFQNFCLSLLSTLVPLFSLHLSTRQSLQCHPC
jgi:Fe2+ transport system protein B